MLCERNCCQDFALCFAGKLITSFQWTAEEEGAFWSTRQLYITIDSCWATRLYSISIVSQLLTFIVGRRSQSQLPWLQYRLHVHWGPVRGPELFPGLLGIIIVGVEGWWNIIQKRKLPLRSSVISKTISVKSVTKEWPITVAWRIYNTSTRLQTVHHILRS